MIRPVLHRDVTDNGLRVLTVEAPHLHSAMVAVYVGTGSRHESAGEAGISHFLEHLFFRGCEAYPSSLTLNAAIERHGGSVNGATARDHGCYYVSVEPGGAASAIRVLGAMLAAPLLEDVDTERAVILEEILDEVDEQGRTIDPDTLCKAQVFGEHPLGRPIAGTARSVRRITGEMLRAHHARHYVGSNLVVVGAGPLRHAEVLDAAASAFETLPRGSVPDALPPPAFPDGPLVRVVQHVESQTDLRLAFPSAPDAHPDHPATELLRRILDDGLASRLQQEVVERLGLAYDVAAELDVFADTALLEIDASAVHAKVPELAEAILAITRDLATTTPSQGELDRAKARHRFALERMIDSVGELVGWYGEGEVVHGVVDPADRIAAADAVSPDDVLRVAARAFGKESRAAVLVGRPPARARRILEA